VYTSGDYIAIMEHLIARWDVGNLKVKDGEDQAYVMSLPTRYRKLAERKRQRKDGGGARERVAFSWISDRQVEL